MIKQQVDYSIEDALKKLFDDQAKMQNELEKEIKKQASRLRISPLTETVEIEISVKVRKVRK